MVMGSSTLAGMKWSEIGTQLQMFCHVLGHVEVELEFVSDISMEELKVPASYKLKGKEITPICKNLKI